MTECDLDAELAQDLARWERDPIAFFVEALGVDPKLIWQPMVDMAESVRDNRQTAVAGCHNSSKTFTAACLSWWWVMVKPQAIVYATGPKQDQLRDTYWKQLTDIHRTAPIPIGGTLLALDWKDSHGAMIVGRTARVDTGAGGATGMQGYKSQHLLMIFDEATSISRDVWESANGVVTFPENRWLALANPTNPNCGFRDCWRGGSGWHTINIDALANPNLVSGEIVHPYLADTEWVESKRRLWGEGSPAWESRVRGRFPTAAIDTLISLDDFERACERPRSPDGDPLTYVGADVAAQGDDYSVIAVLRDDSLVHLEWFHEPDTTKTGDRIVRVAQDWGLTEARARQVSVDSGGLGVGIYNHIRRFHKWDVAGEDFGRNATDEEKYADRRTELWVQVRDWLRGPGSLRAARPDWIQYLEADLCGCSVDPLHVKGSRTVLKLEKKAAMKKRIGRSPDHGDALALALAPRTARRGLWTPEALRAARAIRSALPDDPRVNRRPDPEAELREKRRRERRAGMYDRRGPVAGYD